jgi:hypothetical protein
VHRIRLGRFGFFDPFGAMESIIDAEDPRDELVRVVRLAEAEAGGTGPVSRVVTSLSEALARREPPLAVREHFERYVRLSDETEIDLGRIVGATEDGTPAAVARSVDKLLGFLGNERTIVPWEEARSRLLPRLVSPDFTDNLPDGAKGRGELAIESLTPSLHLALLLGHEGRSRFVRQDEVDAWGTSFAEAAAIAKENLARRSDAARFARLDTEAGPLVIARSGDGLDSARLVLPTLHDVLSPELGSPFLASVPHRDTLLAAPTGPTTIVAALRERTRDDAARAPHRISDALFLVAPDGISDVRGF